MYCCRPYCTPEGLQSSLFCFYAFDVLGVWLAGDSSTPLDAAVSSSTALTLRKKIEFEGLQVELFQDIGDPVAAAEGENVMSHMRSAELQLAADLEAHDLEILERELCEREPFEREVINIEAHDDFETSSFEGDNNRSA